MKTRAARKLAQWLKFCLDIGFSKSSLDYLQDMWIEYHDENGDLITKK